MSCAGALANGVHADNNDCSRYYHCQNGALYTAQCRAGDQFDVATARCVAAELAECGVEEIVTTTTPAPSLNDLCVTSVVGNIAVLPHPQRCDWYIDCIVGRATIGRCGWQLIYSENFERCVPGDPDTCEFFDVTTSWPDHTPVTGGPDFNINDFCVVSIVGNVEVVAHPQRCDWYITCIAGSGTIGRCGWQQIFSNRVRRCMAGDPETCEFTED